MWILEQTEIFEKRFNKLIPRNLQANVKETIKKLAINPYNSKPLGYSFFREKKKMENIFSYIRRKISCLFY